jgi:hypothetical protein
MAAQQPPPAKTERYVVIHVATTCDEHGVYVTKDSAEVIELGWILLDANSLEEVRLLAERSRLLEIHRQLTNPLDSCIAKASLSSLSILRSPLFAVGFPFRCVQKHLILPPLTKLKNSFANGASPSQRA